MTASTYVIPQQLTSCRVMSDSNLTASYNVPFFGTGIDATLTNTGAFSALVIDSVAVQIGDRIAVMGQTDSSKNGIYEVINVGSSVTPWVIQRTDDFQSQQQMKPGLFLPISAGSIHAGEILTVIEPAVQNVGSDPIVFEQASTAGSGTASNKDATDNGEPFVASVSGAFVVGNLVEAKDVLGTIQDSGVRPSDNSFPIVASVDGATVIGNQAVFSDILGTIIDGGPAASGTVGAGTINQVAAYPAAGTAVAGVSVLKDAASFNSFNWNTRQSLDSDGVTVKVDYSIANHLLLGPSGNARVDIVGGGPATTLIATDGVAADIGMTFESKGAGSYAFTSGTTGLLGLINQAGAVNGWRMWASTTGNPLLIESVGTDTDISIQMTAQGAGVIFSNSPINANGSLTANDGVSVASLDSSTRFLLGTDGTTRVVDWNGPFAEVIGLQIPEGGAGSRQGVATLVAGTVTVANTSITANSRIFLTAQDNNSVGALRVSARNVGADFTITSSINTDNGVIAYLLNEPG